MGWGATTIECRSSASDKTAVEVFVTAPSIKCKSCILKFYFEWICRHVCTFFVAFSCFAVSHKGKQWIPNFLYLTFRALMYIVADWQIVSIDRTGWVLHYYSWMCRAAAQCTTVYDQLITTVTFFICTDRLIKNKPTDTCDSLICTCLCTILWFHMFRVMCQRWIFNF